jgi:hypothetical protein
VLSADGQWLTKLLGLAFFTQAWIAWILRNEPHLSVAKALAVYQLASPTADSVRRTAPRERRRAAARGFRPSRRRSGEFVAFIGSAPKIPTRVPTRMALLTELRPVRISRNVRKRIRGYR